VQLPNNEEAYVPEAKLTKYLLVPDRDDARGKASFFVACGLQAGDWRVFESALLAHSRSFEVRQIKRNQYGVCYAVEGPLQTLEGKPTTRPVHSVWIIRKGGTAPRFVTAYPIEG
jgi:hypothetical protein